MTADLRDVQALALLDEPVRRVLYEWVAQAGRAVGRDEAAAGAGISRALAAFHLDRLAEAGLLDVEFRRLSGRTGPGAGRPAKLYRRATREVSVSLPARRYEVPAELFATANEEMSGEVPPEPLRRAARQMGESVGSPARAAAGPRPSRARLRDSLIATLAERGYEPHEMASGEIRFGNCPFDALVGDHRPLVCGMNLALAEGMLDALGDDHLVARLDPQPGYCCIAIALAKGRPPDTEA
jgi:predicted ArsR family transcriptional regulator